MVRIFRKIKQIMIDEKKVSGYLFYALGETILVIIGILIALELNNWNETRKNKLTESDYYCRILDDFELNEILINEDLENTTAKIKICKELIVDINTQPNSKYIIMNTFLDAIRQDFFIPSNIAFEGLASSGNLKLLEDIELKNKLFEFNTSLENTLDLLAENRSEINKRILDFDSSTAFGVQEFDYLKTELGEEIIELLPNKNWTNDKNDPIFLKFQDNLVFLVAMYIRQNQHLSILKKEMEEPIQLLKNKECKPIMNL